MGRTGFARVLHVLQETLLVGHEEIIRWRGVFAFMGTHPAVLVVRMNRNAQRSFEFHDRRILYRQLWLSIRCAQMSLVDNNDDCRDIGQIGMVVVKKKIVSF